MKKTILLILLSTVILSCTGSLYTEKLLVNEDIDSELRNELQSLENKLFKSIKAKNYDDFKTLLSKTLLQSEDFNYTEFLDEIYPFITEYSLSKLDEYYSELNSISTKIYPTLSIEPENSNSDLCINDLVFYEKEAYNSFYVSNGKNLQHLLFLGFSNYDGEWKINIIQVGDYAVNGLTAKELHDEANNYMESNDIINATFKTIAMKKVLNPINCLYYKENDTYYKSYKNNITEINNSIEFPIEISNIKIFNMHVFFTEKSGIIPIFLYKTETELNEKMLKEEIASLRSDFLDYFPTLKLEYEFIVLRAYNEYPEDKGKKYEYFNIPLEL